MKNIRNTVIIIIVIIVLLATCLFFIIRKNEQNEKEYKYNELVDKLCDVTLSLTETNNDTIQIDKNAHGSFQYINFTTLAGLTMNSDYKVPMNVENPKLSTNKHKKYFPSTTRIKITVSNKKVVCNGLIDVGNEPTITLIDDEIITIKKGDNFTDPGVNATDLEDGNLTGKVIKNGVVNANEEGEYLLLYFVQDSIGNKTVKTRKIVVK